MWIIIVESEWEGAVSRWTNQQSCLCRLGILNDFLTFLRCSNELPPTMEASMSWFEENANAIGAELEWLNAAIQFRIAELWGEDSDFSAISEIDPPYYEEAEGPYVHFIHVLELSPPERLLLLLAIAPSVKPELLDRFLENHPNKSPVTEFGGFRGQVHKGFVPTVDTALFLLGGKDLASRFSYKTLFHPKHRLFQGNWLRIEHVHPHEPYGSGLLLPSRELVDLLCTGDQGEPEFGSSFPAQKLETARNWEELILPAETLNDVEDIVAWIKHEQLVMDEWGLSGKVSPGFRCLFYGAPGTGKTLTASLLGKVTGREIYRIDLSMIVSKYIGETEKNLKVVFDKAQSRGWILFFDEADALFGKRTDVSDSKDRYANQEVSYLLQRVENFDGVVVLATNNRDNMDKAFTRRFQVIVNFPVPNAMERLRLWQTSLPPSCELDSMVNLPAVAEKYEMTGGSIMNVVRHCALRAAMRGEARITEYDLLDGIKREYRKAGRIMS